MRTLVWWGIFQPISIWHRFTIHWRKIRSRGMRSLPCLAPKHQTPSGNFWREIPWHFCRAVRLSISSISRIHRLLWCQIWKISVTPVWQCILIMIPDGAAISYIRIWDLMKHILSMILTRRRYCVIILQIRNCMRRSSTVMRVRNPTRIYSLWVFPCRIMAVIRRNMTILMKKRVCLASIIRTWTSTCHWSTRVIRH